MSFYEDCYSFDIKNADILLELKIIPSLNPPALCAKIYRSNINSYDIYWNWGLTNRDYSSKLLLFRKLIKYKYNSYDEIINSPQFLDFIREFTPVHSKTLDQRGKTIINKIMNTNWGPSQRANNGGLDGHRYFLSIYDTPKRDYETWCIVPNEWSDLATLVTFIIDDIIKIEDKQRDFYLPYGTVNRTYNIPEIEIPPWMKKP